MLRAFAIGVIGAIAGVGIKKLYDQGKLQTLGDDIRDGASRLTGRLAEGRDLLVEQTASAREGIATLAGRKGSQGISNSVSAPAQPSPWPADSQALAKNI